MSTEAQTLANRQSTPALRLVRRSASEVGSPQGVEGNSFMQNKPNFRKAEMNITSALARDYENIPPTKKCQNKPNFIRHSLGEGGQTQFYPKNEANKANQTQFQPKNEANKPNFEGAPQLPASGGFKSAGSSGFWIWQMGFFIL